MSDEVFKRLERDGCGGCGHATNAADSDKGVRLFCAHCVRNHDVLWDKKSRIELRSCGWWDMVVELVLRALRRRRREKRTVHGD